jgi:uncharacterized protein
VAFLSGFLRVGRRKQTVPVEVFLSLELEMGRMAKKSSKPWYKDGLCFECTQCGDCCTGEPGLVLFTTEEGEAMAAQLGITLEDFLFVHGSKTTDEDLWQLNEFLSEYGHDCSLLGRDEAGKTWCRAHAARPMQCRTWPFWPDNLRNKGAWEKAGSDCEGIGRGSIVSLRVIQSEMERTPEWGIVD